MTDKDSQIYWKRLGTMVKLDDANPEKYCWVELDSIAFETCRETRGDRKSYVSPDRCKQEKRCWCGKFENRKLREEHQ
jgi:hypothetical protein